MKAHDSFLTIVVNMLAFVSFRSSHFFLPLFQKHKT